MGRYRDELEAWVTYRDVWDGFNQLPEEAQRTFQLIERHQNDQRKSTYNILLMGNSRVGKTSTVENIVKIGGLLSAHELQRDPLDAMPQVLSFKKGDFSLNFIDTVNILDTGGNYDDGLLMLIEDLNSSGEFVDVILYVDRADVYSMNATDLFVAKTISELFGQEAWERVVIVLTHFDALEEKTKKDFTERRKAELNWISKGGDIKSDDVVDTLKNKVAFIANNKKCKEPTPDDWQITHLINMMADVASKSKGAGLKVKLPTQLGGYGHFCERILDDCEKKYFEINNVDDSKGQKEWKSFILDGLSSDILASFNPKEWKTDHLPMSALQLIENVKSVSKEDNKENKELNASFTILVMGRGGGVGKSSTANSIIGADIFPVNKTKGSREILIWSGSTSNFTLRIIEIPDFMRYGQVHTGYFEAIKLFWEVYNIDALLYVDRLDEWKLDDLMNTTIANIASFFGPRILNRTLIVLTHRKSSSKRQFELQRYLIKRMMMTEAKWLELRCGCKVEGDALEAVAVDNREINRDYRHGNKIPKWMGELFEGLNKIYARRSLGEEIRCSKWVGRSDPVFYSCSDRACSRELEKVTVMISVRNSVHENREMNVDPIPGRYKRAKKMPPLILVG